MQLEELSVLQSVEANPSSVLSPTSFTTRGWTIRTDTGLVIVGCAVIQEIIDSRYQSVDVSITLKNLVDCTNLLKVALTAAGNSRSAKDIVALCGGFQDLCAHTTVCTGTFVETCLQALKFHNMALKAMQADKSALALKAYGKVGALAQQMSDISHELVVQTDALISKASTALENSVGDRTGLDERRKKKEEEEKKLKAMERAMSEHLKRIPGEFAEAHWQAEDHFSKADAAAAHKGLVTGILAVTFFPAALIYGGVADGGGEHRKDAREAEKKVRELKQEQRNKAAELEKTLASLQTAVADKDDMAKVVQSLEMYNLALGRIRTRFVHMKVFWSSVAEHCKALGGYGDQFEFAVELCDAEEFVTAFMHSAKGWAALGWVCVQANDAMVLSSNKINSVMDHLPSGSEGDAKIQAMIEELKATMEENEKKEAANLEFKQAQEAPSE